MALPSQAPSNSGTHARQIRSAPAPRFLLSSFVFAVSSPRSLVLMTPASVPAGDPLYPELWRACAGPLVTVPRVGDLVFYFPQGHIEQVRLPLRLPLCSRWSLGLLPLLRTLTWSALRWRRP
jgi:hypothetical protein